MKLFSSACRQAGGGIHRARAPTVFEAQQTLWRNKMIRSSLVVLVLAFTACSSGSGSGGGGGGSAAGGGTAAGGGAAAGGGSGAGGGCTATLPDGGTKTYPINCTYDPGFSE